MEPYVGEIRMFAGNYAPEGWALCNGQIMSIAENELLYSLIGTTYGGNGQTTFALPNFQSRVVVHQGQNPTTSTNFVMGQAGGVETVTVTSAQLPAHTHQVTASSLDGTTPSPENAVWAKGIQYSTQPPTGTMNPTSVSSAGGNTPHNNEGTEKVPQAQVREYRNEYSFLYSLFLRCR
ncbi:tail fiber protein [Lysinibacillus sp. FSL K6-0232]|uniref:phage tail protein n=1 Tax=Lysinibacillus sp. FSL K6-0232 TaxID=2921425 RepID=UPI0030F6622E